MRNVLEFHQQIQYRIHHQYGWTLGSNILTPQQTPGRPASSSPLPTPHHCLVLKSFIYKLQSRTASLSAPFKSSVEILLHSFILSQLPQSCEAPPHASRGGAAVYTPSASETKFGSSCPMHVPSQKPALPVRFFGFACQEKATLRRSFCVASLRRSLRKLGK